MRLASTICVCLAVAAPAARAERYSLGALVERVARSHPSVAASREERLSWDDKRLELQLRWLPFGDLTFSLGGAPAVGCVGDPGDSAAVATANCVRTDNVDLLRGGSLAARSMFGGPAPVLALGLTQPLITSGKLEAGTQLLGRAAEGAGKAYLGRDVGDAVRAAVEAYWRLKAARAAVQLYREALGTVRNWAQRVDAELDGANTRHYSEADSARIRIQLANTEMAMLQHQRQEQGALGALRAITEDPRAEIDDDEIAPVPVSPELEASAEGALDAARRRRSESTLIDLLVDEGRGWWRLRLAEMLPDLAVQSGFIVGDAPQVAIPSRAFLANGANASGAYFALGARQSLDLGPRGARLRAAAAEVRARRARRRMYQGWIAVDTIDAWSSLQEARQRARDCERGERVARGWFAAVDENLSLGLQTDGRELVEVINAWVDFRIRRVWAIADINQRVVWLERATGRLRAVEEALR